MDAKKSGWVAFLVLLVMIKYKNIVKANYTDDPYHNYVNQWEQGSGFSGRKNP
jgi:hypothetical protein